MASSTGWAEYGLSTPVPSMIRRVEVAAAASSTGADRRNRSWDTQSWSNPASSAATASSTKVGTARSLFSRRLVRSGRVPRPVMVDRGPGPAEVGPSSSRAGL